MGWNTAVAAEGVTTNHLAVPYNNQRHIETIFVVDYLYHLTNSISFVGNFVFVEKLFGTSNVSLK